MRDTETKSEAGQPQILCSRLQGLQSRANGFLIPANNWDVSWTGGMNEEIDTAWRKKKKKSGSVCIHKIPADHENNTAVLATDLSTVCVYAVSEHSF